MFSTHTLFLALSWVFCHFSSCSVLSMLPKWMLASIYLDPLSSCSFFLLLPACLCVFISLLVSLLQFLSLHACWFHFVWAEHTGDWELSLYLCICLIWTRLCARCNTLSLHINGHYSHWTPQSQSWLSTHLECLGVIRWGTRWVFLCAEHVSALEGKSCGEVSLQVIRRKEKRNDW